MSERPKGVTSRSILIACLISVALAGGVATSVAAASDPSRPTSDRHATSPGGGGGGGGDPERRVALGLASPNGLDLDVLASLTGMSDGHRPAMWVVWSRWGNPFSRDFPLSTAYTLRSLGVMPVIWWEPVKPNEPDDPTYARHRNITAGLHDDYIRAFARDAKEFGTPVVLRFAQEANADHFPWGVGRFDNTAQTFVAAWRHVHAIFESVGADNVRFLWSVSRQHCAGGCNPYTGLYPGDAYVDILGFSGYNWGNVSGKTWTSMYDLYRKSVEHMRDFSATKAIMVAETGSNSVGGDKAAWIRDGYREVYDRLPDISSIVYLHADLRDIGHPDWRLTSPPAAVGAYAEIAGLPRFSGTSPFAARVKLDRVRHDRSSDRRGRREAREDDAAPKPRRALGPQVHRGSEASEPPAGGGQSSTGAANRRSKKPKADDKPPAGLDMFSQ